MRLKDFFNAVGKVIPYAGFFIGTQSYMMAKEAKAARINQASSETNRLLEVIHNQQETMIEDKMVQTKIAGLSDNINAHLEFIKTHSERIKQAVEQLQNPNLSDSERNLLWQQIKINTDFKLTSLNKANDDLSKILEALNSNRNQIINDLSETIDRYKDFLSSLTLEQLIPFLNVLGLTVIATCLISILMIIYGDHLIEYLVLEKRYPKLAKFIRLRRNFQFFWLNVNSLMILSVIIPLIWINIDYFLFLYKMS